MYTQCPECGVAFRISAEVLQQARGMVRCGSCRQAFNALDHLFESPPRRRDDANAVDRGSPPPADKRQSALEFSDQPRYDDNTPLPEDFADDESDVVAVYKPPRRRAEDFTAPPESSDAQSELELSDPDDWADLLNEVDERLDAIDAPGGPRAPDADGKSGNEAGVEAADGDRAERPELPDSSDEELDIPELDVRDETRGADAEDGVSAYLNRFLVIDDADAEVDAADDDGESARLADVEEAPDDEELIDITGESEGPTPVDFDVSEPEQEDDDELSGEVTEPEPDADVDEIELMLEDGEDEDLDLVLDDADGDDVDMVLDTAEAGDLDMLLDTADADDLDLVLGAADADAEAEETSGLELEDAGRDADDSDADSGDAPAGLETDDVEEDAITAMTANMKIDPAVLQAMRDQELGAITGEDGTPLVETIVMEGDSIQDALQAELERKARPEPDRRPQPALSNVASLIDTYVSSRAPKQESSAGRLFRGGAPIILVLLLAAQVVHNERERLATFDWFGNTLGTVYASMGMPVVPNWDARGWQFEATSGGAGVDDDRLTISSRLSNRSGRELPYPLVQVSLTDRYEEVVGSRVLEPSEYLAGGTNTARGVPPGGDFTARFTFASAAEEATGFKLNVCYRDAGSRIRCALEDFKRP